jgi:hypothetical protein
LIACGDAIPNGSLGRSHDYSPDGVITKALMDMGFTPSYDLEVREASNFCRLLQSAVVWNNRVETTEADVLARLRDGCDQPKETTTP